MRVVRDSDMVGPLPDMGLMPTSTVKVLRPDETGTDPFNDPVFEVREEEVDGVLVQPSGTSDIGAERPYGTQSDIVAHFPKSYSGDLSGCSIELPGPVVYEVVGNPVMYDPDATPGPFGMRVEARRVDG